MSVRVISLRLCHADPDSVISWHLFVMLGQHLSQLPSLPARQSARCSAPHLVAVAPSHVWKLGQAWHSLLRTYLVSAHLAQAAEDGVLLEADVVGEPRRDVDDVAAWPLAEADADVLGDVEGREGPEADRALVAQAAEDAVLLEACGALGASLRSLARPIIP